MKLFFSGKKIKPSGVLRIIGAGFLVGIFISLSFLLVTSYWLLVTPLPAFADQGSLLLQIPIGGKTSITPCIPEGMYALKCGGIGDYITLAYAWLVGVVGILCMVTFAYGGLLWLLARGDNGQVKKAQKILSDTVAGLTLTLCSYLILYIINPNMVKLNPLIIGKITPIDFEFDPEIIREGISASGDVLEYNKKPCPTLAEAQNGFSAFFTTYYKPLPGDKGSFESFLCNVAMQCTCPNGKDTYKCSHGLRACKPFDTSKPYCTGGMGGAVEANSSLAVDTNCFFVGDYSRQSKPHLVSQYWDPSRPKVEKYKNPNTAKRGLEKCKFQIDGIPGKVFTAQDTGDAIWGRHFDYFAGTNLANGISGVRTVKVLNPADCLVEQDKEDKPIELP